MHRLLLFSSSRPGLIKMLILQTTNSLSEKVKSIFVRQSTRLAGLFIRVVPSVIYSC